MFTEPWGTVNRLAKPVENITALEGNLPRNGTNPSLHDETSAEFLCIAWLFYSSYYSYPSFT
jgi:hypothetical protein